MASSSLLAQILRLTTAFYQSMASSSLWARKRYPDVADGVGGVAAVVEGAVGVGVREAQALALRGRERAQIADGLAASQASTVRRTVKTRPGADRLSGGWGLGPLSSEAGRTWSAYTRKLGDI